MCTQGSAAAIYAAPFNIAAEVIPLWDPRIVPYLNPFGLDGEPNRAHNDRTTGDRWDRINIATFNQLERVEIFEAWVVGNNHREADEHELIENELSSLDLVNFADRLRQRGGWEASTLPGKTLKLVSGRDLQQSPYICAWDTRHTKINHPTTMPHQRSRPDPLLTHGERLQRTTHRRLQPDRQQLRLHWRSAEWLSAK